MAQFSTAEILSVLALIGGMGLWLLKLTWNFSSLSTKVDTMWAFQMRRAMSEAVEKGVAKINSPIVFSEDAKRLLDPIKDKLIDLMRNMRDDHTDAEILLAIENKFGDRLIKEVCIPCKLTNGSCLLLAFGVANGDGVKEIEIKL